MITIAYMTCRPHCRIEWLLDSFYKQYANEVPIEIICIDGSMDEIANFFTYKTYPPVAKYSPKPTPWQGKHRLTKDNWFAACNARNTAIIYANGDYIVFVDDLSVLVDGWWNSVLKAYRNTYIVYGAYKKVANLQVQDGTILNYEEIPGGNDHRLTYGSKVCGGEWLYGCSFGAPIDWLLNVNGFDEICGGISYEDTNLGLRLQKRGFTMYYDTDMLTLECNECHFDGIVFKREDKLLTHSQYYACKERMGITGTWQPNCKTDVSHLLLDMVYTTTRSDNAWTWGNQFILKELKETKNFPLPNPNMLFWPDLTPIKDM